ncbi:hypothetical protein PG993_000071 [Apiospora rasikravindrae]|uniref:Uncharacterized protein n=1 Tax=Apiospora rasikravindrae TaxID=990691 RepID=A0ABR1UA93_9PEZI
MVSVFLLLSHAGGQTGGRFGEGFLRFFSRRDPPKCLVILGLLDNEENQGTKHTHNKHPHTPESETHPEASPGCTGFLHWVLTFDTPHACEECPPSPALSLVLHLGSPGALSFSPSLPFASPTSLSSVPPQIGQKLNGASRVAIVDKQVHSPTPLRRSAAFINPITVRGWQRVELGRSSTMD